MGRSRAVRYEGRGGLILKTLLKKLLGAIFPSSNQKIIHWLQVLFSLIERNPREAYLAYRILQGRENDQLMLDVGAHVGGSLRAFALDGWRVFAFEPDAANRAILENMSVAFENVTIDPKALSDEIRSDVPFFKSDLSTGISGLSAFHSSHVEVGKVSTTTVDQFCKDQQIDKIDFLKVDTEGYDLFVLKGVPWDRLMPRVIVCEFEDHKTVPLGYTYHDLANYLMDKGYRVMVSEWYPVVQYGGRHRWRAFAEYPAELRGGPDGYGNLIATRLPEDFTRLGKVSRRYNLLSRFRN